MKKKYRLNPKRKRLYIRTLAVMLVIGVVYTGVSVVFAQSAESKSEAGNTEEVNVSVSDIEEPIEEAVEDNGFRYYEIPEKYKENGGYFPEEVQEYLWNLCDERILNYYMVVALIERESGYRSDAVGDSANSYGYGQIFKVFHEERMAEEGVIDLTDPYGNLRVCTSYLQELQLKYGSSGANCILMAYNMGEPRAQEAWNKGIYSTEYSTEILARAQEIEQELKA